MQVGLLSVLVEVGQEVSNGYDVLVVMEAMKMENQMKASATMVLSKMFWFRKVIWLMPRLFWLNWDIWKILNL